MQLRDLSAVFVTHLHSDHYLELGPLIHTAWTAGLATPVTVWGPEGLARYWEAFVASMAADIDLRIADEGRPDLRGLVSVRVLEEGAVEGLDGVGVRAMRVLHPPLVDCFALSFEGEGKRVVFSGDTAYLPALADFARGADLLVHEAMLEAALPALVARVGNADGRLMAHLKRSHTSAADAARIAAAAGVGALALHHLIPSDDPALDGGPLAGGGRAALERAAPCGAGRDGDRGLRRLAGKPWTEGAVCPLGLPRGYLWTDRSRKKRRVRAGSSRSCQGARGAPSQPICGSAVRGAKGRGVAVHAERAVEGEVEARWREALGAEGEGGGVEGEARAGEAGREGGGRLARGGAWRRPRRCACPRPARGRRGRGRRSRGRGGGAPEARLCPRR